MDLGSGIGAGIGGLLGGADANSGPAGYTTSTKNTAASPEVANYITSILNGGYNLYSDVLNRGTNPLLGLSNDEMAKTISGYYLDPTSNPFLAAMASAIADKTGRGIDSRFSSAGRYGSGAFANTVADAISQNLSSLYGTNYANERSRQYGAAAGAPAFVSSSVGAEFAPYINFRNLIPNLFNTTSVDPYFRNKGAGILGGALAGSQLGKMFGGGGGGGGDTSGIYASGTMDNVSADSLPW